MELSKDETTATTPTQLGASLKGEGNGPETSDDGGERDREINEAGGEARYASRTSPSKTQTRPRPLETEGQGNQRGGRRGAICQKDKPVEDPDKTEATRDHDQQLTSANTCRASCDHTTKLEMTRSPARPSEDLANTMGMVRDDKVARCLSRGPSRANWR